MDRKSLSHNHPPLSIVPPHCLNYSVTQMGTDTRRRNMKNTVFIHVQHKQWLGAVVCKYVLEKHFAGSDSGTTLWNWQKKLALLNQKVSRVSTHFGKRVL